MMFVDTIIQRIKKTWRQARYVEYYNQPRIVRSSSVNLWPEDATNQIQEILNSATSTETREYQQYAVARAIWQAKRHRAFIRCPIWMSHGSVFLEAGLYKITSPITVPADVRFSAQGIFIDPES